MPAIPARGRRRPGARAVLAVLAGLLLLAVAAELLARVVEASTGAHWAVDLQAGLSVSEALYVPHPFVGYVLRPGAVAQPGSPVPFHVNSLGFRGAEIAFAKPPGTLRVATLGGSTTWCQGADEDTWPAVLEALLRQRLPAGGPFTDVEVINAGVSGYTSLESFANLKTRVLPLQPDIVVVYHAVNDARFIGHGSFKADYTHVRRPYRVPLPAASDVLFSWSRAYGWLRPRLGLSTANLYDLVYWERPEGLERASDVEAGIANFRRTLSEIVAVARVNGCEPVLSVFAYTTRRPLGAAQEYLERVGFRLVDRLNDVSREVAQRQGTPLVDVRAAVGDHPAMFRDAVHFSDQGARVVAQAVADTLSALLREGLRPMRPLRLPDDP